MACTSDHAAEDALLKARLSDAVDLCDRRSCPRFVGFLDERQRAVAEAFLRPYTAVSICFFGGHPEAERTIAGIFPPFLPAEEDAFPLAAVGFTYRREASLSHRDFLGALLSCGIKRDKIGDILCTEGLTVAFLDADITPFVVEQLEQVGHEGVHSLYPYSGELPAAHTFREMRDTIASPRLDAVVKTAAGCSREEAARRIAAGLVSLNHTPCLSASATVREGDVLSLRGVGRFRVETIGPPTRKGRLFLTLQKYC